MRILGIETSCDDTAVAIYDEHQGLLGHLMHSQVDLHSIYGGVVPELASRDHIRKLLPSIKSLLHQCEISLSSITGIAYTRGPGLIGSLMVGVSVAKSLSFSLGVPSLGVHHLESHIMAAMLEENKPAFPFVTLLVSGGHTMLLLAKAFGDYEILGETLDDAAGEAFDKTAKLMGLGYPGGPAIAKRAVKGDVSRFEFPRPLVNKQNLNFSFSGLKTHTRMLYEAHRDEPNLDADIAAGFQNAVVDSLMRKAENALKQTGVKTLVVAGGVSANLELRKKANSLSQKGYAIFFPRHEFCTDNAAMVAYNGFLHFQSGASEPLSIDVKSRWPLGCDSA